MNKLDANNSESISRNVRWQYLKRIFKIAIVGIIVLTGISLAVAAGRLNEAFSYEAIQLAPYPQMSFILLILTFTLIVLWYFAVDCELGMLHLYAEKIIPPMPNFKFQAAFLVVLLSVLAYFSNKPVVYSAIFASFKLVEVWLLWIRDQKIKEAFSTAGEKIFNDTPNGFALKTIEHYYLGRPQLPLAVSILCIAFVALIFAVYGELSDNSRLMFSVSYSLLILCIVVGEIVYQFWRTKRDRELGERFS